MAVTRPTPKQVWGAILVGVLIYNSTAEDGDLLSEQVDRWLVTHPVLTRVAITILATHLANVVSPRYDVISIGFMAVRKVSWRQRRARLMDAQAVTASADYAGSTSEKRPPAFGRCRPGGRSKRGLLLNSVPMRDAR